VVADLGEGSDMKGCSGRRFYTELFKDNVDKTELILIGNPKREAKVQHFELTVGDSVVRSSSSARNLGVILDDTLSFKQFCLKSASHRLGMCLSRHWQLQRTPL